MIYVNEQHKIKIAKEEREGKKLIKLWKLNKYFIAFRCNNSYYFILFIRKSGYFFPNLSFVVKLHDIRSRFQILNSILLKLLNGKMKFFPFNESTLFQHMILKNFRI